LNLIFFFCCLCVIIYMGDIMDIELDLLLKETLYLDDNFEINDNMFPGSIIEWDSLSHMNLIYNISNKYNIEIPFKDLKNIENWGQLKKYVCKKFK